MRSIKGGYAVQIWTDKSPQGFSWRSVGSSQREFQDFEGISLITRRPKRRDVEADEDIADDLDEATASSTEDDSPSE